jgi:hypothetical protein
MIASRVVLLLACALLSTACTNPRTRAERQLGKGGAERLRHDAAIIYKNLFAGHGKPDFVEIWFKNWPPSFQKLAPLHVGAYLDGISIALQASSENEAGLYIVPESMDNEPRGAPGATFTKLREGIYWYSFTQR